MAKKNKGKPTLTRRISCDHCGFQHYVAEGGWIINGRKKVYCYNRWRNCLDEMLNLRSENRTHENDGFVLSLDD